MAQESPIINILTYGLPYELANQIYNEYQDRLRDANYLIEHYQSYAEVGNYKEVFELLLALSIFHKRVIGNFLGVTKFYRTVFRKSQAEVIRIGSFDFDKAEQNKLLRVTLTYKSLLEEYAIPETLFDYYLTRDFLRSVIRFKSLMDLADTTDEN